MIRRRRILLVAGACVALAFAGTPSAAAAPGPSGAPEWWVDSWGVHNLWAAGADGRGITIAEIDSGVNAALPELSGKILPGTDFGSLGGNGQVDRETDPFGHGTAMASIMVASSGIFGIEGLAPAAKILPVAIPLIGTQDAVEDDHLADAIKWSVDHGAKIINMSLGANRDQVTDPLACPADEQAEIFYALSKGDVVVAAAGNDGPTGTDIEEPSVCIGVVTVGAINSAGTVASFSSRTPKMTVTAPGVNIPSLGRIAGQAYEGMGTSQASALASAAIALIWSKYPTLTNRQVVARLLATLDRPHSPADPAYGYGQINPASAINTNVPATAANPVFDLADPFLAQLTPPAAPAAPAPAEQLAAPPGHFSAAAPPSDITAEVRLAAGVAIAGLVGLVLLAFVGVRGRRRRNRAAPALAGLSWSADSGGADSSITWHDLVAPSGWAPPTEPPPWTAPLDQHTVVYPPPTLTDAPPPPIPAQWSAPTLSHPASALPGHPVEPADDGAQ